MQLLQSILIFSLCFAGIYILPATLANESLTEDNLYSKVLAQVHSVMLVDTRAVTPAEVSCANLYNNATATINTRLLNQTNACFENANKTTINNTVNVNATVTISRTNLLTALRQINNCSVLADNGQYINCTTATFDSNLQYLNVANTYAYQAETESVLNQNQVVLVREACINAAIGNAKTNLSIATNDYSQCLKNIKYQRYLGIN